MKKILIIFTAFILVSGCASVFSPKLQEVKIITKNKKSKVYIGTKYAGKGDTVKVILKKDCTPKQVMIETDSFKTEYLALVQNKKSDWFVMTLFPFGIFIVPPFYDDGDNTWNYSDYYSPGKLRQLHYWSPDKKRLLLNDIKFNITNENSSVNTYDYDDYTEGMPAKESIILDSVKYSGIVNDVGITEYLKRTNFIDSTISIFIDNTNTLLLNCCVNKYTVNSIERSFIKRGILLDIKDNQNAFYMNMGFSVQWSVTDLYGDTLLSKGMDNISGDFIISEYGQTVADNAVINDALINSLLDLLDLPEMQKLIQTEDSNVVEYENFKINRPQKTPSNIDEALEASLTIKGKSGHGSGFLVSQDGYIITNYHVINNEKELKAVTKDGKEYIVSVVRFNKDKDLALLKTDGNFQFAFAIPDEKYFKTGQDVFAIGTPNSVILGQSVSKGIISGLRSDKKKCFIQMDVPVNKGNSGGAVVNSAGELIGVVEYKIFGLGVEGISFSIPAFEITKYLSVSYQ